MKWIYILIGFVTILLIGRACEQVQYSKNISIIRGGVEP